MDERKKQQQAKEKKKKKRKVGDKPGAMTLSGSTWGMVNKEKVLSTLLSKGFGQWSSLITGSRANRSLKDVATLVCNAIAVWAYEVSGVNELCLCVYVRSSLAFIMHKLIAFLPFSLIQVVEDRKVKEAAKEENTGNVVVAKEALSVASAVAALTVLAGEGSAVCKAVLDGFEVDHVSFNGHMASIVDDERCDICDIETSWAEDPILFCEGCDVAVHKDCYG